MASKEGGAYGGATTTTGKERKTWDKAAYADKAKEKDEEYAARAKERAEALKQGEAGVKASAVAVRVDYGVH